MVGNEKGLIFDSKYGYSVVSAISKDKQGFNLSWDKDFEFSLIRY